MKKNLLKLEKATATGKNPTALGGLGKLLGYPVSWLAFLTSESQVKLMEFDAAVEPAVSVKERYSTAFSDAEDNTLRKIDKLRKAIDIVEGKLAKAKKPSKVKKYTDDHKLMVDELDRQFKLLSQLRKKMGK